MAQIIPIQAKDVLQLVGEELGEKIGEIIAANIHSGNDGDRQVELDTLRDLTISISNLLRPRIGKAACELFWAARHRGEATGKEAFADFVAS